MSPINGLANINVVLIGYKHVVPTARRPAVATTLLSVFYYLCSLRNLRIILISVWPAARQPVASLIQTPPDSATSKSLHTSAALHPSRDSWSATLRSSDHSEIRYCPANTAGSLPATASDNRLSRSKALRPSRAGCCKSRRCRNAAFALWCDRQD